MGAGRGGGRGGLVRPPRGGEWEREERGEVVRDLQDWEVMMELAPNLAGFPLGISSFSPSSAKEGTDWEEEKEVEAMDSRERQEAEVPFKCSIVPFPFCLCCCICCCCCCSCSCCCWRGRDRVLEALERIRTLETSITTEVIGLVADWKKEERLREKIRL